MDTRGTIGSLRTLGALVGRRVELPRVVLLSVLASLAAGAGVMLLVPILALLAHNNTAALRTLAEHGISGIAVLPIALAIAGLLVGARVLLAYWADAASRQLEFNVVDRLRHTMYAGLLGAEWHWLTTQRSADHVAMLSNELARIGHGLRSALQTLASAMTLAIYGLAALVLSPQIAVGSIVCGALLLMLSNRLQGHAAEQGRLVGPLNIALHRVLQESVARLRTIRLLSREDETLADFSGAVSALRVEQSRYLGAAARAAAAAQLLVAAIVAAIALIGHLGLGLPVERLLPLLLIILRVAPLVEGIRASWLNWLHAAPAAEAAQQFIATLEAAAEPRALTTLPPLPLQRELRLSSVSFRYRDRSGEAVSEISLHIAANSTTVIAGPSGAGKSTLADLISGLLEPDSGSIAVDGRPLSGSDRLRWRASVAYVDQAPVLLHASVRENLLMARPRATDAELRQALAAAAADFVLDFPEGLETIIGDDGVRLSGGQRQRLAVARALLKRPQLLILDEATNALDEVNCAAIATMLRTLHGTMTVIVISHEGWMDEMADQIVTLSDGILEHPPQPFKLAR